MKSAANARSASFLADSRRAAEKLTPRHGNRQEAGSRRPAEMLKGKHEGRSNYPPPGIPEGTGTRMQSKEGAVNRQRYEGCPDSGAGAGARERVAGRLGKQHTHKKSKRAAEGSRAGTQEDPPPYCWDLAQPTTARRGKEGCSRGCPGCLAAHEARVAERDQGTAR